MFQVLRYKWIAEFFGYNQQLFKCFRVCQGADSVSKTISVEHSVERIAQSVAHAVTWLSMLANNVSIIMYNNVLVILFSADKDVVETDNLIILLFHTYVASQTSSEVLTFDTCA